MKTILFSFLIFLFFYGCSNDNLVNTNNFNSPPAQQNEFDLIGFEGKSIFTFEVNPINPNYIIVSTKSPRGLYLTSNFGRNWTLIDSNIVTTAMKYSLIIQKLFIYVMYEMCQTIIMGWYINQQTMVEVFQVWILVYEPGPWQDHLKSKSIL